MQLSTWTRPDISYSVPMSSSKTLSIGWKSSQLPQNSPIFKAAGNSELLSFTDSVFASCEETRKSRSRACIFFCNSVIYWKSGKQNHVSRSTTEAEFYALLEGITEVEFLQNVIPFAYQVDKRIFNCKNTPIFCNNSTAGKIASSIESIAGTKHIEVAHLWIQKKLPQKESKFTL